MFSTVYDTTKCQHYVLTRERNELTNLLLRDPESQLQTYEHGKDTIPSVLLLTPGNAPVPAFSHPLIVESPDGKTKKIIVDVRGYTGRRREDNSVVVRAETDYDYMRLRGYLEAVWLNGQYQDLLNTGDAQLNIFSRWLSEALTRTYALAPESQMITAVITAMHYLCMFNPDADKMAGHGMTLAEDERLLTVYAQRISRATNVNATEVVSIIEELVPTRNVLDLCHLLKTQAGTIRFEHLDPAALFTIVSASWFTGMNTRETCAVALEHPPTFIAMLYTGFTTHGAKRTIIGTLCDQYQKRNDEQAKAFVKSVVHIPLL